MTGPAWVEFFCLRLAAAMHRECPAGLGTWEPAWAIVDPVAAELNAELDEVEKGRGDREKAKALGQRVLAAWKRAREEWAASEGAAA